MRNTWYIVRHGQSENNVLEVYNSSISEIDKYGLTHHGRQQVMSAAQDIGKIDKIFTSPFRRTMETADIFHTLTNADLHIDHRLREIDLGTLHDQPHRDLPDYDENEPIAEGESITQIRDRMLEFVTEVNAAHEGLNILIVTHGGPMEILRHYLNNDHAFRFTGVANVPKNGEVIMLSA